MVHDGPLCAASIRCRQTIRSSNKSARLGLTASWQQSPHETRQGNCSTIRSSQDSRAVLGPESTKQGDAMATGFSPLRCFLVLSRPQPPVAPRELAISEWKPPKPSGPCEIHDPLSLPAGPKSCGTGRSPRTIDKLRPSGVKPSDGVHREGLKIHIEMVAPSPPDGCIAATAHKITSPAGPGASASICQIVTNGDPLAAGAVARPSKPNNINSSALAGRSPATLSQQGKKRNCSTAALVLVLVSDSGDSPRCWLHRSSAGSWDELHGFVKDCSTDSLLRRCMVLDFRLRAGGNGRAGGD